MLNPHTFKSSLAVKLQVTVDFDLTDVVSVVYSVSKPDGTTSTWTATVETALTGITSYTTTTGDLSQVGTYILQPKATFASQTFYGEPISFEVNEIIT